MRNVMRVGMKESLEITVSRSKTVPFLYPEAPEFQLIPEVFATGYMVGLMEWCCIRSLAPALEFDEGSLGTLIEVSHLAPTLPGSVVKVEATVTEVDGRQIAWNVSAWDEIDLIGEGKIGRVVVSWQRFEQRLKEKKASILRPQG